MSAVRTMEAANRTAPTLKDRLCASVMQGTVVMIMERLVLVSNFQIASLENDQECICFF